MKTWLIVVLICLFVLHVTCVSHERRTRRQLKQVFNADPQDPDPNTPKEKFDTNSSSVAVTGTRGGTSFNNETTTTERPKIDEPIARIPGNFTGRNETGQYAGNFSGMPPIGKVLQKIPDTNQSSVSGRVPTGQMNPQTGLVSGQSTQNLTGRPQTGLPSGQTSQSNLLGKPQIAPSRSQLPQNLTEGPQTDLPSDQNVSESPPGRSPSSNVPIRPETDSQLPLNLPSIPQSGLPSGQNVPDSPPVRLPMPGQPSQNLPGSTLPVNRPQTPLAGRIPAGLPPVPSQDLNSTTNLPPEVPVDTVGENQWNQYPEAQIYPYQPAPHYSSIPSVVPPGTTITINVIGGHTRPAPAPKVEPKHRGSYKDNHHHTYDDDDDDEFYDDDEDYFEDDHDCDF